MQRTKKICLVLPRGEAIKNFVWGGTSKLLMEKYIVQIVSVKPNDEIWEILKDFCHELYELPTTKDKYYNNLLTDWLDMVHGRWLWSGAAQERWMLRDHDAKTPKQKLIRNIKKATAKAFATDNGVRKVDNFRHFVAEKVLKPDMQLDLLKKLNPDVVFNGSHIHSRLALPMMHAARILNIPIATFLFSWDNLTSQGRVIPQYDHYMVWNKKIHDHFLELYPFIPKEKVTITGTSQFDFHFNDHTRIWSKEEFATKVGVDLGKKWVMYTTGMPNHMPGEHLIVERIADGLKALGSDYQLFVRVYPKDRTGRFDEVKERRKDIVFPNIPWEQNYLTPTIEDCELLTNMLHHCSIGINVASTVTLELAMFDKPIINIGYNPPINIYPKDYPLYYTWDHYKPIVDSGALSLSKSPEETDDLLKMYFENPTIKSNERKQLIKDFFGEYLDGKAYERVAGTLSKLAEK